MSIALSNYTRNSCGWWWPWWYLREGLPVEGEGPGGAPPAHALRPVLHGGAQGVGGLPGGGGHLPGVGGGAGGEGVVVVDELMEVIKVKY